MGLVTCQTVQVRVHDDLLFHCFGLDSAHENVVDLIVFVHVKVRHVCVPVFGALSSRLLRLPAVLEADHSLGAASVLLQLLKKICANF